MEDNCVLFGINIAVGTKGELYERCCRMIGEGGAVCTVNPEIMSRALEEPELKEALLDSLCIPDGIGVELALRMLGCGAQRFPGVELGEALLEGERCVHLGIIGGEEGVAERAMQMLVMRHRNVIPEFTLCGFGLDERVAERLLTDRHPDIVFVCLGSPKQELFIKRMRGFAPRALFIGLGGSADIYSGEKKRAPMLARKMGFEWAWRILCEPKRLKRVPHLLHFFINFAKFNKKSVKIGKKTLNTRRQI